MNIYYAPCFQIKLFCMHPVKMMMESKLEVHKDKTLREATEMAYKVCLLFFFFCIWVSNNIIIIMFLTSAHGAGGSRPSGLLSFGQV